MPETPLVLQWARWYVKQGWSVIPVKHEDKIPILKGWDEYGRRLPTEEELVSWFSNNHINIGIVTGHLSGLVVVDIDSEEGAALLAEKYPALLDNHSIVTTTKGKHLYFKYPPNVDVRNKARLLPGVDIRAEGGFVVAPPSLSKAGHRYRWETKEIGNIGELCTNSLKTLIANGRPTTSGDKNRQTSTFSEGTRDNDLYHAAVCMRRGGMDRETASKVLELLAKQCSPPMPQEAAMDKVRSAYDRSLPSERNLTEEIRSFVASTNGDFLSTDVDKELGLSTKGDKGNRSKILSRLIEEGIIERSGNRNGQFRRVQSDIARIDWKSADCSSVYQILWPFNLERLVNLYPKNIGIVAGASNAGKSALLYNLAKLNCRNHKVRFMSSEVGPEELKLRLSLFDVNRLDEWEAIDFIDRSSNYAHAVDPDGLNIIDYLELSGDAAFYSVGGEIKAIFDRLRSGVAIIAIQKKNSTKNATYDMGRGAEFTLEKARIYLSIDHNTLKIVKGKNWATPGVNPNGRVFKFRLVSGCRFMEDDAED